MATAEAAAGGAARSAFAALIWQHLVNDGLANYLPGILPIIAVERHLPLFMLSFLSTALLLGQMLQPLSGVLADAVGGRALMLGGPLLSVAGAFGVSYAHSFALLATSLFMTGIGSTLFHPQALAAARSLSGRRQGLSMSGFLVGGEFGRALGPLAAGVVVVAGGLTHLWLVAIPVLLTFPWLLRVVPRLAANRSRKAPITWRKHLKPTASLLLFTGFRAGSISGITIFMPLLWKANGGSLIAGASLVTTMVGVGIVGNLAGGALRDRFGPRPIIWGSTLTAAALTLVLLQVHGLWLWPILSLMGIALFSTSPVTMLLGQDIFPENPALGSGVALGLGNGIGALLLLALGYAASRVGLHAALGFVVALLLIALLGIPGLMHVRHEERASLSA